MHIWDDDGRTRTRIFGDRLVRRVVSDLYGLVLGPSLVTIWSYDHLVCSWDVRIFFEASSPPFRSFFLQVLFVLNDLEQARLAEGFIKLPPYNIYKIFPMPWIYFFFEKNWKEM
jgi:hypothetical protein